mmetsp:Transcript_70699/g.158298  ORF Transcript_70699/g.158298 Transcript_70699/m.158298 type:complete len:89 (+) Transcript_70699:164-430(+)
MDALLRLPLLMTSSLMSLHTRHLLLCFRSLCTSSMIPQRVHCHSLFPNSALQGTLRHILETRIPNWLMAVCFGQHAPGGGAIAHEARR